MVIMAEMYLHEYHDALHNVQHAASRFISQRSLLEEELLGSSDGRRPTRVYEAR